MLFMENMDSLEHESVESWSFSTAEDLAFYLDNNCKSWSIYSADFDLLQTLRAASVPAELASLVLAEQVALDLWFKECSCQRKLSMTDKEGNSWGSTLPNELQPPAFDYYQQRLAQSTNPYLRARYGLVLWNAPKPHKHIRYAQAALDNLLNALENADCIDTAILHNCLDILRQSCAIAASIHYRTTDTMEAVIQRFTEILPFEVGSKISLLRLVTKYPKLFKSTDHDLVLATSRKLYEIHYGAQDYFACQSLCQVAAPYAQAFGYDPREWHFGLGKAFEGEAVQRSSNDNESSLMAVQFYSRAAKAYQLAGAPDAEAEALLKVQLLKPKIKLATISTELTPEQSNQLMNNIRFETENLLKYDSDEIMNYLACHESAIPNYLDIKAKAAESEPSFLSMLPIVTIDGNKNTQHRESSFGQDRNLEWETNRSYSLALSFHHLYLTPLFIEGYSRGKINFETFCQYLDKYSWIAQPLTEYDISAIPVEYTWRPILYPGIEEFFKQLNSYIINGPQAASFVLAVDSLALKIEGLFRDALQRLGIHTIATHKRHDLREVYFDDLVELARTNDLFTESECYFFRYVFTPIGKNLRNDIAHGYYHLPENYSLHKAILLMMALLRISGFLLLPKTNDQQA